MGRSASRCATPRSPALSRRCAGYISKQSRGAWETRMCGIIGVSGLAEAARLAYLGLYSLQHRGQESAGVVAVDGEGVARAHRGMGLVSDVLSAEVMASRPGDVGIGHTRYSTAGSSALPTPQPIPAVYPEGLAAVA